jgi:hypothetical protein
MKKIILPFCILFLFSANIFADNYSLSFDYMDGYAVSSLTSDEIFGDNYTFTVESWYKNDGVDSGNNQGYDDGANIVSNYKRSGGGDPYNNFTLSMVPENHGDIGTFNMQGAGSVERYDDGQWHHVVGIIEKTSENSATSILYVDGEFISQNELGESDFISSYNKIYINNHSPFAGDHMQDCSVAGIRVSSGKRYSENFSPEFPLSTDGETIFNLDFSSGDGSTLGDLSSNGHNFAIQGNATWSTDVPVNDEFIDKALSFSSGQYARIEMTESLNNLNDFSIELWYYELSSASEIIFGNENANSIAGSIQIKRYGGNFDVSVTDGSITVANSSIPGVLSETWQNLSLIYDGEYIRFFIDGTLAWEEYIIFDPN